LLENAGHIVEKEDFRKKVEPDIDKAVKFDNCLKRAIATLRKALGERKSRSQYIITLSKRGYVFVAVAAFPDKRTLAVLPFQGFGRTKEPGYFIDGLSYEIITQLGRVNPEQLRVIAPISSLRYKGTKKKIREIGRDLKADYLLTGAVLRARNKVRISVQLIQVMDESQVWAETYERKLDDILVLLREVCQDIARKIEIKLVPHEQARLDYVTPVQPEAYNNYLNGRYLWNKRTPKTLQEATVLFKKAIALDSGFALAHSALADCYAVIASQSWISPKEACDNAKIAAISAMQLDRSYAEPHAALGFVLSVFEHNWEEAEQEFQE